MCVCGVRARVCVRACVFLTLSLLCILYLLLCGRVSTTVDIAEAQKRYSRSTQQEQDLMYGKYQVLLLWSGLAIYYVVLLLSEI